MKPYQSEEKIIIRQTPKKQNVILKIQNILSTNLKSSSKQVSEAVDSGEKEEPNQKYSMSKLCQSFIERFRGREQKIFETKTLVLDFGVKQRRIYDLMNIMEGCGCLKKLSKGKYQWKGVQQSQQINIDNSKNESTSLRQIASRIKLLFSNNEKFVTFTQINQLLIKENKSKGANPASIRRRIYECCKVLRILGYIDKFDQKYQWVLNVNPRDIKVGAVEPKKKVKKIKKLMMNEKQLIVEIVGRYPSQKKFCQFVEKLTKEHGTTQVLKKEEAIFEQ